MFSSYGSKLHKLMTDYTGNSSTLLFWKLSRNLGMTCLTTLLISPARQADVFAGGANPLHDRVNTICPGEEFSEGPWRAGCRQHGGR